MNRINASRLKTFFILFVIASAIIVSYIWENKVIELNKITVVSEDLPKKFDGFRIAHISDVHNAEMGKDNSDIIEILEDVQPDIIAITGDLIDSRKTNLDIALKLAEKMISIAPCYYVTGNHEARIDEYTKFKAELVNSGVTVLENDKTHIDDSGASITVIGINDPSFDTDYLFGDSESIVDSRLGNLKDQSEGFTLLLSHRPELFDIYVKNGIDLTLSGHAHGGQFREPYIGGIFAPHQGFFPKYDSGIYTEMDCSMIVSRGIGNSLFPFRSNNRPEIILVELKSIEE